MRVRVPCDPPDGPVVCLGFACGALVAVESEGMLPLEALDALAGSQSVTFTSGPLEDGEREPLMREDSFLAWLATRGAYLPNVLLESPQPSRC